MSLACHLHTVEGLHHESVFQQTVRVLMVQCLKLKQLTVVSWRNEYSGVKEVHPKREW